MPWETENEVAIATHGSDARAITVTLSSGNFVFDLVETKDDKGVVRGYFAVGETVGIHLKTTNKGDVKAEAAIKVTDSDTGSVLFDHKVAGAIAPKSFLDYTFDVGKMPERNWRLLVEVKP